MIHGHPSTYSHHGCRCDDCRTAQATYQQALRRDRAAGRPRSVPADASRAHIQKFLRAGFHRSDVARAAQLSHVQISRILDQQGTGVYADTERRILALTISTVRAHTKEIPSHDVTRMIRELTALGWTTRDLAQASGVHAETIREIRNRPRPRVRRDTTRLILHAYMRLLRLPAPEGREARMARRLAAQKGWPPPAQTTEEEAAA